MPQWQIIERTITSLLGPFTNLLLVTFTLYLVFSIIADRVFGGLANNNENRILRDQSVPDLYIEMNFNDLSNSFVTLFTLMIINNWFVIVQMFVIVTGTIWTRTFFVAFYFLSVIVVLNIVVAFAIDMYSSVDTLYKHKTKEEDEQRKRNAYVDDDESVDTADFPIDRENLTDLKLYQTHHMPKCNSDLLNFSGEPESKLTYVILYEDEDKDDLEESNVALLLREYKPAGDNNLAPNFEFLNRTNQINNSRIQPTDNILSSSPNEAEEIKEAPSEFYFD
jgi:hypothetical protein